MAGHRTMERALSEIDLAAGGLLTRGAGTALEVAVVRRSRHDDWVLPKGHPEAGEDLRAAALREVREETGCEARILRLLPPLSYLVGETPKLVVFFEMTCTSEGGALDPNEVSELRWLPPAEAAARLTHTSERALLTQTYAM